MPLARFQESPPTLPARPRYLGPAILGINNESTWAAGSPSWATMAADVQAAGGKVTGHRIYARDNDTSYKLLDPDIAARHNAGAAAFTSLRMNAHDWATYKSGNATTNGIVDAMFDALMALDYTAPGHAPFSFVCWDPEMPRLGTPWGGTHGTPAEWKLMNNFLYERLRSRGAGNERVLVAFCVHHFALTRNSTKSGAVALGSAACAASDYFDADVDDHTDVHGPDLYNKSVDNRNVTPSPAVPDWSLPSALCDDYDTWMANVGADLTKQRCCIEGDVGETGFTKYGDTGQATSSWPTSRTHDSTLGTSKQAFFNDLPNVVARPQWLGWLYWNDDEKFDSTTRAKTGLLSAAAALAGVTKS